jgi:hypothetical protein
MPNVITLIAVALVSPGLGIILMVMVRMFLNNPVAQDVANLETQLMILDQVKAHMIEFKIKPLHSL